MAKKASRTLQLILDEDFNIIGTAQGGTLEAGAGEEVTVGAVPQWGQQIVEIEVPEEIASADKAVELHAHLKTYMG
jgi:hypothetical protein